MPELPHGFGGKCLTQDHTSTQSRETEVLPLRDLYMGMHV